MSGRLVILAFQAVVAISFICYGLYWWLHDEIADEPFSKYQCLEDCVANNLNKRDPYQYCRAIRSKVRRARRRKSGII